MIYKITCTALTLSMLSSQLVCSAKARAPVENGKRFAPLVAQALLGADGKPYYDSQWISDKLMADDPHERMPARKVFPWHGRAAIPNVRHLSRHTNPPIHQENVPINFKRKLIRGPEFDRE